MNVNEHLIGIDIGTSSSKGILVDSRGTLKASADISHGISRPFANYAEQDADLVWWNDLKWIVRKLLEKSAVGPEKIRAITISTIYPVIVPVDSAGRPLRPAILYGIDYRAKKEIEWFQKELTDEYSERISGFPFSSQSIAPKILWIRNNEPEVFSKTDCFMYAGTYLNYKLCGRKVVDHASASLSGLPYDLAKGEWDEVSLKLCGISKDRMPELVYAGQKLGTVTKEAAEETGLSPETMVVSGLGDHAAETFAIGGGKVGQAILSYGSTFGIDICSDHPVFAEGIGSSSSGFPDRYSVGGCMYNGAVLTKWFRDCLADAERETEKSGGQNAYQILSEKAGEIGAGSDGLITVPYFSGERTPVLDPDAVGILFGLKLTHNKYHIYRSLLEGVAFGIRQNMENMKKNGIEIAGAVALGGGTRSKVWCQILSDVTGIPQTVMQDDCAATIGDAMVAGIGCGLFDSYEDCSCWILPGFSVKPREEHREIYDRYYSIFKDLYVQTCGLMKKIGP